MPSSPGIDLISIGVGMGNFNDALLEQLADRGNGFYAYINDQTEADRVFGSQLTGTLDTIARDARVQVEFNPSAVAAYRLLGYENRAMPDQDFSNPNADAGEVGAGHSVTALYEIQPTWSARPDSGRGAPALDRSRHGRPIGTQRRHHDERVRSRLLLGDAELPPGGDGRRVRRDPAPEPVRLWLHARRRGARGDIADELVRRPGERRRVRAARPDRSRTKPTDDQRLVTGARVRRRRRRGSIEAHLGGRELAAPASLSCALAARAERAGRAFDKSVDRV